MPHSLRNSYGTQLVAGAADLRTAQTLLRHTNLQTTAIYVQVADERRAERSTGLTHSGKHTGPVAAMFTCTHCNAVPEQIVKAQLAIVRHELGCPTLLAQVRVRRPIPFGTDQP
jgi:Phage integrase family